MYSITSELKIQTELSLTHLRRDKMKAAFGGFYNWTSQSWRILFFPSKLHSSCKQPLCCTVWDLIECSFFFHKILFLILGLTIQPSPDYVFW